MHFVSSIDQLNEICHVLLSGDFLFGLLPSALAFLFLLSLIFFTTFMYFFLVHMFAGVDYPLSLSLSLSLYIYIYIYINKEFSHFLEFF